MEWSGKDISCFSMDSQIHYGLRCVLEITKAQKYRSEKTYNRNALMRSTFVVCTVIGTGLSELWIFHFCPNSETLENDSFPETAPMTEYSNVRKNHW